MLKFTSAQLAGFNKAQLRESMRAHSLQYDGMNVEGMRNALAGFAEDAQTEGQPAQEPAAETQAEVAASIPDAPLPARAPRVLTDAPVVAPVAPTAPKRTIQSNRPEQNGVKRPSEGTKCAQIWAHCDEVYATGAVPAAKAVREHLKDLDNTTCTVQYYRWRKFNNIQGRN